MGCGTLRVAAIRVRYAVRIRTPPPTLCEPTSMSDPFRFRSTDIWWLGWGIAATALTTLVYVRWLHVANPATVSPTFLMLVLVVAAAAPLWTAIIVSFVAVLSFNYFFLPPVGTFTIADPQN